MRLKRTDQKTVVRSGKKFLRALETPYNIYFTYSDEVLMYRKQDLKCLGGGAMVENSLLDDIENKLYTWVSSEMQSNIAAIEETERGIYPLKPTY
jgi:hypothetical protein